jgi:hypothetical protein
MFVEHECIRLSTRVNNGHNCARLSAPEVQDEFIVIVVIGNRRCLRRFRVKLLKVFLNKERSGWRNGWRHSMRQTGEHLRIFIYLQIHELHK